MRDSDQGGTNNHDRYWLDLLIDPASTGLNAFANALCFSNGPSTTGAGAVWDADLTSGYAKFNGDIYLASPAPVTVFKEMSCVGPAQGYQKTAGDWHIWINGVEQQLYVNLGVLTAGWTQLVGFLNYSSLGSINRTQDDLSPRYSRLTTSSVIAYGPQVMFGPSLNPQQRAAMRSWLINQ